MEEEIKEIIGDVVDLYKDMKKSSIEELKQSHNVYGREYKKILYKIESHYNQDWLGPEVPQFITESIKEMNSPEMVMGTTTLKRVEMGLRKIARILKIELPEENQEPTMVKTNIPPIQNIITATQSQNVEVKITNEVKIEVNQAIKNFEEEMGKKDPDLSKLRAFFGIVKKVVGIFF